jgi:tripartite-type tricarboxylate transporter receptor subunit TctC
MEHQMAFPVLRSLGVVMITAVFFTWTGIAIAQTTSNGYPSKAIRLTVPYAPGGATDIVARYIGQRLNEALGQSVLIDNRGGASGTIGTDLVAKAAPDGHSLLVTNVGLAFNATLFQKLPYDTQRELAPVSLLASQPNILLAHPSLPVKTVKDLLALAKARPGAINYSSGGNGSGTHLAAELLKLKTRIDIVHIPYKGAGPALTDLVGGHVQIMVSTLSPALPHVQAGKLRPLAVTSITRSPALPEVPTLAAAGVPGYEFNTWHGLFAPSATPRPVIDRLNGELKKILSSPVVREKYAALGVEVAFNSPEAFAALLKSEIDKWGEVVRVAKIQID